MLSPVQMEQLNQAANDAVACELATKVPAELTVAQWALESGWGTHQPGNNCFGIKSYDGCFGVQSLHTTEVVHGAPSAMSLQFATFPSLAVCFEKHAELISSGQPYAHAWAQYLQSPDLPTLVRGIAPVYSTSPGYASELLSILSMDAVKAAISGSRNAASPAGSTTEDS